MFIKSTISYSPRFILLFILFAVFFMLGSAVMTEVMPTGESEPGLVSDGVGFLIMVAVETSMLSVLILTSRWNGWKLAFLLSLAYYGAVTVLMQIETWYFLTKITVDPEILPALFIMRLPVSFLAIPLFVWILGKGRAKGDSAPTIALAMSVKQWAWKLPLIVIAYLALYLGAGYFIAWQNPEVRLFYTGSTELPTFWEQNLINLRETPTLIPFQIFRALLWTLCALPIIRGSKVNVWWTALLVGLMFSLPQNVAHIIANPLMPIASVRLSHLIETASSTFIFGTIVVWLLHRHHHSLPDLFGLEETSLVFIRQQSVLRSSRKEIP